MKKITLLLLSLVFATQVQAQFEPDLQKFFKSLWSPIVQYDSIVVYSDTGANAVVQDIASMTLFPDGNFSAMNYYDSTQTLTSLGIGVQNTSGSITQLFGFENPSNLNDTTEKYVFIKNQAGHDSVLTLYINAGGTWKPEQSVAIQYAAGTNQIETSVISVDFIGSGNLTPIFEYNYYFNSNRLDSVEINGLLININGVGRHHYDPYGKLLSFTMDEGFLGDDAVYRYDFRHNTLDEIVEVIESELDTVNNQFNVVSSWKYLKKQNSNISVKEETKVEVSLYPNPARDFFTINTEENFDTYEILSLTGKVLESGKMKSHITVKDLHRGIYFLRLKNDTNIALKKFHKL